MVSVIKDSATLRRRRLAALTVTGVGGAAAVVLTTSVPSAVGAADPCAASETARTISNVARSAGDYLDGHPETNQAMTTALLQPAGPQSADSLRAYLEVNTKAASDLQTIALPLAGLASRCQTPQISLPQVLGFPQFALSGPPTTGPAARAGYGPSATPPVSGSSPGVSAAR